MSVCLPTGTLLGPSSAAGVRFLSDALLGPDGVPLDPAGRRSCVSLLPDDSFGGPYVVNTTVGTLLNLSYEATTVLSTKGRSDPLRRWRPPTFYPAGGARTK